MGCVITNHRTPIKLVKTKSLFAPLRVARIMVCPTTESSIQYMSLNGGGREERNHFLLFSSQTPSFESKVLQTMTRTVFWVDNSDTFRKGVPLMRPSFLLAIVSPPVIACQHRWVRVVQFFS